MPKENCYECRFKRNIPGDCHISCENKCAKVEGHKHGIDSGWFWWPFNFDPTWLEKCNGFEKKD